MSTNLSRLSRRLVPTLALVLSALFVLTLPIAGGATGRNGTRQEPPAVIFRAQGSTGEDVPLAGAEGRAEASVEVNGAPADAVVSSVQVKYDIVYAEPSDLEVQLRSSGTEASYTLWSREGAEGDVLSQSTEEISAFQGAPVNGTWTLAVQGGNAEGYVDDFSVVVYYEAAVPIPQVREGPPGTPAILRLPEGVVPAGVSLDMGEKPLVSGTGLSVVPQDVPPGATIIKTENFEGAFPNPGWQPPVDQSNDGYERYWDDANCDRCGGDWAAWPAAGGGNRVNPCAGNNYPNNMQSWMVYGPFDLSDADDAGTEFTMWYETETDYDFVFFGVSHDCREFTGLIWDGYAACTLYNIGYPDWVGDPSVCVAWMFYSDAATTRRGPWVDDITIWKNVSCPTVVRVVPADKSADTGWPFTVDVAIENASNLGAFQFELAYDRPCVESATAVTLGPFLGSTGRSVNEQGPTFGTGVVTYGAYSLGSSPPGPNGGGVLATVTLRAGANVCDGNLRLQNVILTDVNGNSQCVRTESGIVHVRPGCPRYNCPEDLNCDGVVNIVDIQLVANKWNQRCPTR